MARPTSTACSSGCAAPARGSTDHRERWSRWRRRSASTAADRSSSAARSDRAARGRPRDGCAARSAARRRAGARRRSGSRRATDRGTCTRRPGGIGCPGRSFRRPLALLALGDALDELEAERDLEPARIEIASVVLLLDPDALHRALPYALAERQHHVRRRWGLVGVGDLLVLGLPRLGIGDRLEELERLADTLDLRREIAGHQIRRALR